MITAILESGYQTRLNETELHNLLTNTEVWIEKRNEVQTQFHFKIENPFKPFEFSVVVNNHSQHHDHIIYHMKKRLAEAKARNN